MTDADDDLGIRCPSCGCRHCPKDPTKVDRTVTLGVNQSIRRYRICRNCGRAFITKEVVVGVPEPTTR